MNFRPSSLFAAAYRMQSQDHLALRRALDRHTTLVVVLGTIGWFASLSLAHVLSGGGLDGLAYLLSSMATGRASGWSYALLLVPPAIAALQPFAARIDAELAYRRTATANRDVSLDFTPDGIETGSVGFSSRVSWDRITRLIETPAHLFLMLSDRDAVILPRRAIDRHADYDNLVGFIRARTGLRTA